jgi:alpha-ketoglutarate-dependent taurine dioxygenase
MGNTIEATITVTLLGNGIGAQVDGVKLCETISPDAKVQMMAAWMQHMVLRFRGQQGMSTQPW